MKNKIIILLAVLFIATGCSGSKDKDIKKHQEDFTKLEAKLAEYGESIYNESIKNSIDDQTTKFDYTIEYLSTTSYDFSVFKDPISNKLCDQKKSYITFDVNLDTEKGYNIIPHLVCENYESK